MGGVTVVMSCERHLASGSTREALRLPAHLVDSFRVQHPLPLLFSKLYGCVYN